MVASIILMSPFSAYAAVNITLQEVDAGPVAIRIDTETDTLESVTLPISYSEGVEITDVTDGDIACSELNYTESQEATNTILVTCKLDSATALDGVLANIAFTSTADTPATFKVVESDELDLGTLTLGETVNFEQTSTEPTTGVEQPITTETPTVGGNQETVTATETSLLDSITDYLPYILIAGSVILLVSIVVLLLRKDKSPKQPKVKENEKGDLNQTPPVMQTEQQSERFLRDMVNNPNSAPVQTAPAPMSQNTPQTPTQPTYTPPITSTSQEEDLQEILQRESSIPTAMGDNTPQVNQDVPFSTGFSVPPQQESPENIMPEAPQPQANATQAMGPVTSGPETEEAGPMEQPQIAQDLQESVNKQINQINGGVIPPEQPTQPEPQPQISPITSQQNQDTDNTPEEIPPVPPTM